MGRPFSSVLVIGAATLGAACKGERAPARSEQPAPGTGQEAAPAATLTIPEWMKVDRTGKRVSLEIVGAKAAGEFNFNGYSYGNATITVPEGFAITVKFSNASTATPHSIGVSDQVGNYPATFTDPQPAFPGGMSSNPTSLEGATQSGRSETIRFTAARAGHYALVCYIAGHAVAGMWIRFDVSAQGEAGFTESR